MSRKCIQKLPRAKQLCDLLAEVGSHIALRCMNFSHKFLPSIHDSDHVFQVTAPPVIIFPSVTKCFQFRRTKIWG